MVLQLPLRMSRVYARVLLGRGDGILARIPSPPDQVIAVHDVKAVRPRLMFKIAHS